ncbi:hypothetical protein HF086_013414 [Spodoptera exigua]|uniref:EGF-like domain-containing protein n=1 Tax=Spodoptera exigua TaxID=7107 RepID=A0A922M419_SPOEX|nr:hypothetical protein HF086_013414 [Spodoptera exigua]
MPQSAPTLGTGEAIPADDIPLPQQPVRRPVHHHQHAQPHRPQQGFRRPQPTVRIDTCIVGDDSTCDQTQNEKCRTEADVDECSSSDLNDCHQFATCTNTWGGFNCSSGYYGSTCEVDGEVVGVAVGASLLAALVIAITLAALMSWSNCHVEKLHCHMTT